MWKVPRMLDIVRMDYDTADVGRSAVRWALGGTIAVPFFFQIERSDTVDASVGLRWSFSETGLLSVNALVPLNRAGLRPDVVPTVGVEWRY